MATDILKRPCKSEINRILRDVQAGNMESLTRFKENCPNLHWCELRYDKTGETMLHVSARLGFINIVTFLLTEYQPNAVDCPNNDNKTALHEAAQFAQHVMVKYLLKHKASVNALKRGDWTPLMLACAKINVEEDNFKCVEFLLQNCAIVNYENKDGWTALHLVCRAGSSKILFLLLDHGVDVSKLTKNGRSALHVAALHGHLSIVKILVHLGLDANLKDSCGNTPLHEGVLGGNLELCIYLLGQHVKADATVKNNSGFGVLHLAASLGYENLLEYFINNYKLDVNAASCTNLTPLHCAARKKQIHCVDFLISVGSNAYFRDNFGRCAADYLDF